MNIDIPDEDRSDEQSAEQNSSMPFEVKKGLQLNRIFLSLSSEDQDKVLALAMSLAQKSEG